MALDPIAGKVDLASMTMRVNGTPIPDLFQISQVRVHKEVNRIPSAKITLRDGSPALETFVISASDALLPGAEVELTFGYHGDEASVFTGIIVKHAIKVSDGGPSSLVLSCYGLALKMTQGRTSGYLGKSDSAAFSQLIGAAGLTPSVSATTDLHDAIVKYYATDWDFMVCRAELNGQIVVADGPTVTVGPPLLDADTVLLIGYGDALRELDAEIDARSQFASVTCTAWDFSAQALATASSSEPTVNAQGNLSGATLSAVLGLPAFPLQSSAPVEAAQLGVWANAQLLKSRLARLRGSVSFRGNAGVLPGQMVELDGLGERFNGNAFVASVTHTYAGGDWLTRAGFGMPMEWFSEQRSDIAAPPASGLAPGVPGLLIGKVKQIDQDPDGQSRVLVDVPAIGMDGDGVWARLASAYATKNGGIFFVPEIGDEVILGFLNDDPRFPIVLGSLYSSVQTAPFPPDAPNTNKAIVTKAQLKICCDDVKKQIQISTPGGHIITLNDDDQSITLVDSNKNKMTMSSAGITLDSPADITLKAGGSVTLNAGTTMTLKAAANMDLQALNLSAKATTALVAQGQVSAEFSSGAEVTVRAPMIMIN